MNIVRSTSEDSLLSRLLDRIDFKIAVRNGVGAGLALLVGNLLGQILERPNPIISSLWTCITTILILQAHLGGTYRAAWNRFLGLIVGTLIGGATAAWFGTDSLTLSLSIAFTIAICSILKIQESFRIATATVAVIIIVWQLNPEVSPWLFSMYRFTDSCFGILIGVAVAHTIWPFHAREKLRLNIAEAIENLGNLYRLAIADEAPDEDQRKKALDLIKQIDDNFYNNRQILEDSKAELLTKSARVEDWAVLLFRLDEVFEQILSMKLVYKPDTRKLLDEPLRHQFQDAIDKIDVSFKAISFMMEKGKWNADLPDLDSSLNILKDELARFRGTKTTRTFSIEDVEAFFVFFYSLKTLLGQLKRIEGTIHSLIDEESF